MRKKAKIIILIVLIILTISAFTIIFLFKKVKQEEKEPVVVFSFQDEMNLEKDIEVFTESFEPDQILVTIDGIDSSSLIEIDTSQLDLTKIGTYEVRYFIVYNNKEYDQKQTINVIDSVSPIITLEGSSVTILVGEDFKEPGYKAADNYDKDITDKVEITNEIDNKKVGEYKVKYKVIDSSGNEATQERIVKVKKANTVVKTPPKEEKVTQPKVVETNYNNTLKTNKFNSNNVHLEGYLKNVLEENKIKLVGTKTYEYNITVNSNNYTIDINPEEIDNGKYNIYINDEKLLNKIAPIERLTRSKVGSKLVTLTYSKNDEVSIEISNHSYQYDILISPGHGGSDSGAVNEYIEEKEMNLTISLYEKCRYESHGLKVYMTRTSDKYGDKMGPSDVIRLHRIGYEMGYYGAVSRIVYSNHHNSNANSSYSGWEILVPATLTKSELKEELEIASKWNSIFSLNENHIRFYARDYDTDLMHSKLNGEIYSFKDYYALNRIPYQTANVKSVIFEDCYMSNKSEFNWYWKEKNWYKVSETKIEAYVKALGKTYNSDNSSCK